MRMEHGVHVTLISSSALLQVLLCCGLSICPFVCRCVHVPFIRMCLERAASLQQSPAAEAISGGRGKARGGARAVQSAVQRFSAGGEEAGRGVRAVARGRGGVDDGLAR